MPLPMQSSGSFILDMYNLLSGARPQPQSTLEVEERADGSKFMWDTSTGQIVREVSPPTRRPGYTLGANQSRFDADHNLMSSAPKEDYTLGRSRFSGATNAPVASVPRDPVVLGPGDVMFGGGGAPGTSRGAPPAMTAPSAVPGGGAGTPGMARSAPPVAPPPSAPPAMTAPSAVPGGGMPALPMPSPTTSPGMNVLASNPKPPPADPVMQHVMKKRLERADVEKETAKEDVPAHMMRALSSLRDAQRVAGSPALDDAYKRGAILGSNWTPDMVADALHGQPGMDLYYGSISNITSDAAITSLSKLNGILGKVSDKDVQIAMDAVTALKDRRVSPSEARRQLARYESAQVQLMKMLLEKAKETGIDTTQDPMYAEAQRIVNSPKGKALAEGRIGAAATTYPDFFDSGGGEGWSITPVQ